MDCKTEYHWFDEPNTVRIRLEKDFGKNLINKAILKASSKSKLAYAIRVSKATIFNYFHNTSLTVGGLKKILDFLGIGYLIAEDKVEEIAWSKGVKLPIKLNSISMATILAAIMGDGTINEAHVEYKNSDSELLNKVEREIKNIFGDVKISNRISDEGVPYLIASRMVRRVLKITGVPTGKKLNQGIGIPKVIMDNSIEIQKAFLQQFFDDEGWAETTNYKIGLSQANECTKAINERFLSEMKIGKPYSINKIPKENRQHIKPPKILIDARKILCDNFLVESNLRLKRIIKRKKGYVTAFWEIDIGKKESILNFSNKIGFYCSRKRKTLDLMIKLREKVVTKDVLNKICEEGTLLAKEKGFFRVKDLSGKIDLHPYKIRKKILTLVNRGIFSNNGGKYCLKPVT
ncbi:MAG: hypothetical protein AB1467_00830 [Candidatus Diapherotrites archaeon]